MEEDRRKEEEKAVGKEREKRERNEKRMEEQKRRRRRKRDMIWRGLDGEDQEERRALLERFMEVVLDRKAGIVDSTEVNDRRNDRGTGGC